MKFGPDQCGLAGCHPANRKVTGSVLAQGTCLGCGFDPPSGCILEATGWCFSRWCSLSPSLPSSLRIIIVVINKFLKMKFVFTQSHIASKGKSFIATPLCFIYLLCIFWYTVPCTECTEQAPIHLPAPKTHLTYRPQIEDVSDIRLLRT